MSAALSAGMFVALFLRRRLASLDLPIGEIIALDDRGVRIRLADFDAQGQIAGYTVDLWVPWENIASAMVALPQADRAEFCRWSQDWTC